MADFRRCIIVLATLALLLGTAVTASAQSVQPLSCNVNAFATPLIRQEGVTEKVGDLVITCTGGQMPDPFIPGSTVNVQIFSAQLGVNLTSKILSTGNNASEALLLVDEPDPTIQHVCQVATSGPPLCRVNAIGGGTAGSPFAPNAFEDMGVNPYNVFQGQQVGPNSIAFLGVPFIPPGTNGSRTIRITNIRINGTSYPSTGVNPVTVFVSTSPSTVLPIVNSLLTVAFVEPGLKVSATAPPAFQQCFSVDTAPAGSITFTEGFATAFKVRDMTLTPGVIGPDQATPSNSQCDYLAVSTCPLPSPNTESGFFNNTGTGLNWGAGSGGTLTTAGVATAGTRLRIYFQAVQNGVTITGLPLSVGNGTGANGLIGATLVLNLVGSAIGGYTPGSGTITPDSSGNAEAVYEVVAEDPSVVESVTIPFFASFTANPGAGLPALGTSNFNGSFAPAESTAPSVPSDSTEAISLWNAASSTDPIPRFIDSAPLQPHLQIVKCATHLLFPYVTNVVGFDTGIAIANTSQDPYGTSVQDGTCQLNWFGAGGPWAPTTTPVVTNGTTWASTAMGMQPGFNGYVIADCQFQYAHGFAFVTRVGAVDVAMGYLALVIPDYPPRFPNPVSCPPTGAGCGAGSGEQLGE